MDRSGQRAFPRGRLREVVAERTARALRLGALLPIDTRETFVEDRGVRFVVRRAENLARKEAAGRRAASVGGTSPAGNPFLPYDPDLYVCDVSETHVALLNKYNVIEHHLLIVTRVFEHQETLLTRADFDALARCLAEWEGLGFYNSGPVAGASQPHKHLQVVPLPLAAQAPPVPIQPLLDDGSLPVRHEMARFAPGSAVDAAAFARGCHAAYLEMLGRLSIQPMRTESGAACRLGPAYNLLVTREWMLMARRRRETVDGISVNALGFAGSFFVKSEQDLEVIRSRGPIGLLRQVGDPTGEAAAG